MVGAERRASFASSMWATQVGCNEWRLWMVNLLKFSSSTGWFTATWFSKRCAKQPKLVRLSGVLCDSVVFSQTPEVSPQQHLTKEGAASFQSSKIHWNVMTLWSIAVSIGRRVASSHNSTAVHGHKSGWGLKSQRLVRLQLSLLFVHVPDGWNLRCSSCGTSRRFWFYCIYIGPNWRLLYVMLYAYNIMLSQVQHWLVQLWTSD